MPGHSFGSFVFTPTVKALQERYSRHRQYAKLEQAAGSASSFGEDERSFIADRDSFYMASVGATGSPYIQHRGGPKGLGRALVVTGVVAIAVLATTAAGVLAQRDPASSAPADFSSAKWVVSEGMDSPESVSYDADSGFVFVSQIGGQAAAKDGNGRISKLTLDGKVVDANWVTGLNGPKGQASQRGTLWVADIDEVVGIDIKAGRVSSHLKIDGAQFLNDLAIAPDGTIYTSDSFGNRIYAIKDGKASVFFEGADIPLPNGVLVDGPRLIVAADGRPARGGAGGGVPATLVAIDFATKQLRQVAKGSIGTPDGVEHDGHNGFVLSDVGTGRILQVAPDGEVKILRQLAPQPADICYIPARHLLIVPHLGPNKVAAYELNDLK